MTWRHFSIMEFGRFRPLSKLPAESPSSDLAVSLRTTFTVLIFSSLCSGRAMTLSAEHSSGFIYVWSSLLFSHISLCCQINKALSIIDTLSIMSRLCSIYKALQQPWTKIFILVEVYMWQLIQKERSPGKCVTLSLVQCPNCGHQKCTFNTYTLPSSTWCLSLQTRGETRYFRC